MSALSAGAIASACSVAAEKAQVAHAYLVERGDEALFACAATKLQSGTDRLVLISRYRLLLVRWKFRRAAFKEMRLLDLRGITCEGDVSSPTDPKNPARTHERTPIPVFPIGTRAAAGRALHLHTPTCARTRPR